jgi:sodium-dependent dicarboxylate transporter 2/3/5
MMLRFMTDITLQPNHAARRRSVTICTITAAVAVATYYLLPGDMNELARRTITIFIVAAVFWATEALPLYATSLCIIGLEILFLAERGGLAMVLPARSAFPTNEAGEVMSLSSGDFLQSFASPIIILFMGGFLISSAVTKHGLDRVIGAKLLRPFAGKPTTLIFAVLGITAFFSMWMSNTATAAMMLAIVAPLVRGLPDDDRFHRAVILAVPFGANIGGIGTPIGTPPNAVALAALRMAGYRIGFLDWMIFAVPLSLLMLTVAGILLLKFFPPAKDLKLPEVQKAGAIDLPGRMTLIILCVTIALWLTSKWHGVSDAVVALLAAAALTALRVLDRRDVDHIDWNVLILMWGGLSLGDAMQSTGMVDYVVNLPIVSNATTMSGPGGQFALALFVVGLSVVLSTFMSNTATAALIVPMAMALSPENQGELAVLTALACSFAMAMPVSTPPNAIAMATGQVPVSSMVRSGGLISIISMLVLLCGYQLVLPLFLKLTPI